MKKAIFIFSIFSSHLYSFAQYIVTKTNEDFLLSYDNGSLVIKNTRFTEVGNTSLPERNCKVVLKARDGKTYNHVNGRIDLLTGKFIFTVNEQDFICTVPAQQIVFDSCDSLLHGAIFKNDYPFIDKQTDKSFYQLLVEGKATLLKHYEINWQDATPYNSTNITRTYTRSVKYYLYLNKKMYEIKKNNRNLPKLLAIHSDYIFKKKIDLKKQQDVIQLVTYYNSL